MSETTIKCACSHCGAKYRLPLEAQGRSARCKRCGQKFEVPKQEASLEDSVLQWLMTDEEDREEADVAKPRVISMPGRDAATPEESAEAEEAARKMRGPIRMKTGTDSGAK